MIQHDHRGKGEEDCAGYRVEMLHKRHLGKVGGLIVPYLALRLDLALTGPGWRDSLSLWLCHLQSNM